MICPHCHHLHPNGNCPPNVRHEPPPQRTDHALTVLSVAVLEMQRENREMRRHIEFFYYVLREMGHHPDTIHVALTTGERPLNPNDQAIASVIESSSKTGKVFPVDPANLQFSIDNGSVATVAGDGTVTAIAEGTATLTVKDTSNGLTGTVGITVTNVVVSDSPDTLVVTLTPIVAGAVAAAASKSGAKPVN